MTRVQTVLGDIHPADLGRCQTHEHVVCDQRLAPRSSLHESTREVEETFMILDDYPRAVQELEDYGERGGQAVVEVTTSGWGRDVKTLAEISRQSGIHIIATGGFYIEPCIPYRVDEWSIDRLTRDLVQEVTVGVEGTGIKVGVLKSGIYRSRIEGIEEKALRAVARASLLTGVAITTHTTGSRRYEIPGGNMGREHLRVLEEEGVRADRLIVGHVDERPDLDFLCALADAGCYIQLDTVGKLRWLRDETRAQLVLGLIARGHLSRILLSTDRCRKAELYRERGGLGYTYIFDSFLDTLQASGVTAGQIDQLLIANPARAFSLPG